MSELEHSLQRSATDQELADHMGIPIETLRDQLGELSTLGFVALDELLNPDERDSAAVGDVVPDATAFDPSGAFEKEETRYLLADSINRLPERDRELLTDLFVRELSYKEPDEVSEAFVHALFDERPLRRYMVVPNQEEQSWIPVGYGIQSEPGNNYQVTTPAPVAQTPERRAAEGVNIYAFPNPATREALAEFQAMAPSRDDPTGVRVAFANLPRCRCSVQIFTLAGDLVQTIDHDGSGGDGQAYWNLISRNGQEIVSGIYLYVVQSEDDRFEDFIGKFVVVR